MKILFLFLAAVLLTGCQALSDYDRTLGAGGNLNTRTGFIEYEIRPAAKRGEGRLGGKVRIEGKLSDGKQVIAFER